MTLEQLETEEKKAVENFKLVLQVGERVHSYECAPDSPLGEVYDSLCKFRGYILNQMAERHNQEIQAQQSKEETTQEE